MSKRPAAHVSGTEPQSSGEYAHDQNVNASGHVQEMSRGFSVWSIVGLAISVGNVWPAAGGSIVTALYNGGPPGR